MVRQPPTPDYGYRSSAGSRTHDLLRPIVEKILGRLAPAPRRALDLGCGNGGMAGVLQGLGYDVCGVDTSESGIRVAQEAHPGVHFTVGSAYDDLAKVIGRFPLLVSLEVIEHLYSPRLYVETVGDLLEPGGVGILSTPYHGYLKNLALAATNRMDSHFSPLWEGGHIKFWSVRTLGRLLSDAGFSDLEFHRVGRIPPLAKSMIVAFRRGRDL